MYPDLNRFRRRVVPVLEQNEQEWFGRDIMFTKEVQDYCYAGTIKERTINSVVAELRERDNTYPCNAAALKYYSNDSKRVYERASYAYRPEGFRGKWQYHIRLWPSKPEASHGHSSDKSDSDSPPKGTAVFAHKEINPWYAPIQHYNVSREDGTWRPRDGIKWARTNFEIDPDISHEHITKP